MRTIRRKNIHKFHSKHTHTNKTQKPLTTDDTDQPALTLYIDYIQISGYNTYPHKLFFLYF